MSNSQHEYGERGRLIIRYVCLSLLFSISSLLTIIDEQQLNKCSISRREKSLKFTGRRTFVSFVSLLCLWTSKWGQSQKFTYLKYVVFLFSRKQHSLLHVSVAVLAVPLVYFWLIFLSSGWGITKTAPQFVGFHGTDLDELCLTSNLSACLNSTFEVTGTLSPDSYPNFKQQHNRNEIFIQ